MNASPAAEVSHSLPREFVGQMLENLDALVDEWENTAEYLEHGVTCDDLIIHECNDADEARKIRDYYTTIHHAIAEQVHG